MYGITYNDDFGNEAFHSYLREIDKYPKDKFLKFSINDIKVIILDNQDVKKKLISDATNFQIFGGQNVDQNARNKLPKLIKAFADIKELEDI